MVTYRTDDATRWGPGKGANLTPGEIDTNFWELVQRITAAEGGVEPNSISNINVNGSQMTIYLTDGTAQGPFSLPVATMRYRGDWAAGTAYAELDLVNAPTHGIYLVLRAHTPAAGSTFDPNAVDANGQPLYRWIFPEVNGSLAGLKDVSNALAPVSGHVLSYNGTEWVSSLPVASITDLLDVTITAPVAAHFLRHNGTEWVNAAVAWGDVTAKPATFPPDAHTHPWGDVTGRPATINAIPATLGAAGQVMKVDAAGTGIVWAADDAGTATVALNDVTDVTITTPTSGQVLKFNGTEWVNAADDTGTGGATDLTGLSDVTITTPVAAHFLRHNGTEWVNAVVAWGDIPDKPTTFPPSSHTHPWADVTGRPATINAIPATFGAAGQLLKVNSTADGFVWAADDSGGGSGAAGHTHWRVRNKGSQSDYLVAELTFGAADETGSTVIYSGQNSVNVAANAFDNNAATIAQITPAVDGWVGLQLAAATDVAEVTIQAGDTAARAANAPHHFLIEYSDDGTTWAVAREVVGEPAWAIGEIRTYKLTAWDKLVGKPATIRAIPPALGAAGQVMKVDAAGTGIDWDVASGALNDLTDVAIATPATGHVVQFDGTSWINSPLNWAEIPDKPATFPPSAHTHPWGDVTGRPATIDAIPATLGSDGQILKVSGTGIVWARDEAGGNETPHRHWRLRFIRGQSTANAAITELFLNGVSHVGTVSASSVYNASYPAAGAYDNDLTTTWISLNAPVGEWVAIDLGAGNEIDVASVDIHSRVSGTLYEPLEFAMDWSDDGTTWVEGWTAVVSPNWVNNERRTFKRPVQVKWPNVTEKPATINAVPATFGAAGQLLKVNSSGDGFVWANEEPDAVIALNGLSDVTTTTPAGNDILQFNGTEWVNSPLNWAEIPDKPTAFNPSAHLHDAADISVGQFAKERFSGAPGFYEIDPSIPRSGVRHNTLDSPTIGGLAVESSYIENKMMFAVPNVVQVSTDNGATYVAHTFPEADLKGFVMGRAGGGGELAIDRTWTQVRFQWDSAMYPYGYVYLNYLYMYHSTKGNVFKITIERQDNADGLWYVVSDSDYGGSWPGHSWIPHSTIPFQSGANKSVRVTITPRWDHATNDIRLYRLNWHGTYPAASGGGKIYDWNSDGVVNLIKPGATVNGSPIWTSAMNESGTFTPRVEGSTTVGTGTYNAQVGSYSRVGNRCFFNFYMHWTAHTGAGNLLIRGLPLIPADATNAYSALSIASNGITLATGYTNISAFVSFNADTIVLRQSAPEGNHLDVALDTSAWIMLSGHYKVA